MRECAHVGGFANAPMWAHSRKSAYVKSEKFGKAVLLFITYSQKIISRSPYNKQNKNHWSFFVKVVALDILMMRSRCGEDRFWHHNFPRYKVSLCKNYFSNLNNFLCNFLHYVCICMYIFANLFVYLKNHLVYLKNISLSPAAEIYFLHYSYKITYKLRPEFISPYFTTG